MFIIIVGCGRLGSSLARSLQEAGNRVSVVDWSSQSFARIEGAAGVECVLGTGIDIDVLRRAGAEEADALAAVTDNDNANIMIAQTAERIFHIGRVVARVNDPRNEALLAHFGIEAVCPTSIAAHALSVALMGGTPA